ncbi:MAG: trypsin-like peptidase domain-containing protein [Acidimicrobiales bacterium]|nr:trypsin-like peptidase domain-containing protein [Acidimicrobiales bacterium]
MSAETRPARRRWGLPLLVGVVALVAGVVGGVIAYAIHGSTSSASGSRGATCAVTGVANKVLPSVVTISVMGPSSSSGQATGGTGSGEVIRSSGYILTNNHVIAAAASGGSITVLFNDGKTTPATLVGRDPLTDLAVIKVNGQSSLKPVSLGSSSSVKVGEPVVALGAPLGLSSTVTSGIVSALDRTIQVPGESSAQSALLVDSIQTDAAINPGNSGGVLSNCGGQMIGVPSAGATVPTEGGGSSAGNIGLGFAIPVNLAKTVSDEIISTGNVTHSFFGLLAEPVRASGSVDASVAGLLVTNVIAGGPAAHAGLRADDLIISINGDRATDTTQLVAISLTRRPGDRVELGYERNGQRHTATVTLGRQPSTGS